MRSTILALILCLATPLARGEDLLVYFGTHVTGSGNGFSLSHFDTQTGALSPPKYLLEAPAPAYFVIDPDQKFLFTCNSTDPDYADIHSGGVSSYRIDRPTGALTFLSKVPSGGEDPSYISLDKTEHFAFVANYKSGSISVIAIHPDGKLGNATASLTYSGHGTDPVRQTQSHAHSIIPDPTNKFVLAADLGLDVVKLYKFDSSTGWIQPSDPPELNIKPGSGARHMAFAPSGKFLYVISEMGSLITVFNWDPAAPKPIQTISTVPDDFKGNSAAAEITIHPSGKFLYATNRGHDSLAVFTIDPSSGKLTLLQHISTQGKTPRNFALDPTARWLLVTNHDSNNAVVFSIDQTTGKLTQTGDPVAVPYPFCPRFLRP